MKKIFAKGFNPSLRNSEIQLLTQKQLEMVQYTYNIILKQ